MFQSHLSSNRNASIKINSKCTGDRLHNGMIHVYTQKYNTQVCLNQHETWHDRPSLVKPDHSLPQHWMYCITTSPCWWCNTSSAGEGSGLVHETNGNTCGQKSRGNEKQLLDLEWPNQRWLKGAVIWHVPPGLNNPRVAKIHYLYRMIFNIYGLTSRKLLTACTLKNHKRCQEQYNPEIFKTTQKWAPCAVNKQGPAYQDINGSYN